MTDRKRLLRLAVIVVVGPAVTVLGGLASITSFAADMDVHGATTAMRFAAVAAFAVVVIPTGIGFAMWRLDRIDAKAHKAHKAHKAQLAALRYGAHSTSPRGQR